MPVPGLVHLFLPVPGFTLRIADASPYMRSLLRGLDGQGEEEMEVPTKSNAGEARLNTADVF